MNGNQKLALDVLGYMPNGYVCCSQSCNYVRRGNSLLIVGHISSNGRTIACVLLDPATMQVQNV